MATATLNGKPVSAIYGHHLSALDVQVLIDAVNARLLSAREAYSAASETLREYYPGGKPLQIIQPENFSIPYLEKLLIKLRDARGEFNAQS